jgi:membrane protein DedA with SNARE-associated domain
MLAENAGLPTPGESLLIAGGILAAKGKFFIWFVIFATFTGAAMGSCICYVIGFFGGRRLCLKYKRFLFIDEAKLQKLEYFFNHYGGWVIIASKFVVGLRQLSGVVAGISEMNWRRFLVYNIIGAALWSASWISLAYFLGSRLDDLLTAFTYFEYLLLAFLFIALITLMARRLSKKKGRA